MILPIISFVVDVLLRRYVVLILCVCLITNMFVCFPNCVTDSLCICLLSRIFGDIIYNVNFTFIVYRNKVYRNISTFFICFCAK